MEFVADILAEDDIETRLLARDPERPNLVARVPGRAEVPPLLLHGHVDVMPANADDWNYPPLLGN